METNCRETERLKKIAGYFQTSMYLVFGGGSDTSVDYPGLLSAMHNITSAMRWASSESLFISREESSMHYVRHIAAKSCSACTVQNRTQAGEFVSRTPAV